MYKYEFSLLQEDFRPKPDFKYWLMKTPGDVLTDEKESVLSVLAGFYPGVMYVSTGDGDIGRLGAGAQYNVFVENHWGLSITKAVEKLSGYMEQEQERTIIFDISSEGALPYSIVKGLRRITEKVKSTNKRIFLIINEVCKFESHPEFVIERITGNTYRFPAGFMYYQKQVLLEYLWECKAETLRRVMACNKVYKGVYTKKPVTFRVEGVPAGALDMECKVIEDDSLDITEKSDSIDYSKVGKYELCNMDMVLYKIDGEWNRPSLARASKAYNLPVWYVDMDKYVG